MYHHLPLTGIKGRLQTRQIDIGDDTKRNSVEVVAEKVTFLSTRKSEE